MWSEAVYAESPQTQSSFHTAAVKERGSTMKAQDNLPANVLVVGGGITGIVAALRLAERGASVVLVDRPLSAADNRIGGFARFSGAKFSLPPAGLGLAPLAGSQARLLEVAMHCLALLGLPYLRSVESVDQQATLAGEGELRSYESIVLTPDEIECLLDRMEAHLKNAGVNVTYGTVDSLSPTGAGWETQITLGGGSGPFDQTKVTSDAVFFAAGRLAEPLLEKAGAMPTEGKGLDVGFRIEFDELSGLQGLRRLGPDAKIIDGPCRTFCLNSPGKIYHYPFGELLIPGGVVADHTEVKGNVGILMRVSNKRESLSSFVDRASPRAKELHAIGERVQVDPLFKLPSVVAHAYTPEIVSQLEQFCIMLHREQLIDLRMPHRVHVPLLDWHWQTWASRSSHQTSLKNIYALGDSSGHARGLLQGAISGWLAAEEFLC